MRLLPSDMSPETVQRIEQRMRPGTISVAGFLAKGESLVEVIRRDEAALDRLGVPPERIAERLWELLEDAESRFRAHDRPVPANGIVVAGRYHVYGFGVTVSRFPACPFENDSGQRCDGHLALRDFRAHDFAIVNGVSGMRFGFPILGLHLIADHHFFEGSVQYRVDPLVAARTLDLVRGAGARA